MPRRPLNEFTRFGGRTETEAWRPPPVGAAIKRNQPRRSYSISFNHLQQPSATFSNLQQPSTTFNNLQQPSTTFNNLQQPSTIFNNLQ
jgi:hypothetical protein